MLTELQRSLIETWRLGQVATVNADGTPNLSPKGTFVLHDAQTLGFAAIRSPRTLANLAERPGLCVTFSDLLSRRALRIDGQARLLRASDPDFQRRAFAYRAGWPDLADRIKTLVLIEITAVQDMCSPVYDGDADEAELRAHWMQHIQNTYIKHRFAEKQPC